MEMRQSRNVILISIDDLRFDCIGCEENKSWLRRYNADAFVDTPNIDHFAVEGSRFSQCISVSSYTPASHASMLTGTYPYRHGVKTFLDKLSNKVSTLPEILNQYGYKSFASIEQFALRALDITRGFMHVDNRLEDEDEVFHKLDLNREKGASTFLFLHVFDIHNPYYFTTGTHEDMMAYNGDYHATMQKLVEGRGMDFNRLLQDSEKEARRVVENFDNLPLPLKEVAKMRALSYLWRNHLISKGCLLEDVVPLYVKGVAKFDKGKFATLISKFKELNLLTQQTLLIITSDHGEYQCEWDGREDFTNKFHLVEGSIRVPLIFWSPERLPQKVINTSVSLIDIVPTILDFLEIDYARFNLDGASLLPMMRGEIKERPLFSETWAYKGGVDQFGNHHPGQEYFRRQIAIRSNNYKYIETGETTIFSNMVTLLTDEFIKTLYRKILGRFENEHELGYWRHSLNNQWITRSDLWERFIEKSKTLGFNQMLFDLTADPWEENNLAGIALNSYTLDEMAAKVRNFKRIENVSRSISRLKASGRF